MKILCPECFSQITRISKKEAVCSECNSKFDINTKASIFRVRLDGGYIKNGISYMEVVKSIQEGEILADEYIATPDGPWITVYDSSFVSYIPKKGDKKLKETRTAVTLYRQRKAGRITILSLGVLLIMSVTVNFFLLWLMFTMQNRIGSLVEKLTGGI